jgi:hypothetical protein
MLFPRAHLRIEQFNVVQQALVIHLDHVTVSVREKRVRKRVLNLRNPFSGLRETVSHGSQRAGTQVALPKRDAHIRRRRRMEEGRKEKKKNEITNILLYWLRGLGHLPDRILGNTGKLILIGIILG